MPRRRLSDRHLELRYWAWRLRDEGKAILLLIVLAALGGAALAYAIHQSRPPDETVEAVVVRFGIVGNDVGDKPLVIVRTADGRLRQLAAHRSRLLGCSRGAPIRLVRRGNVLGVHPAGCRPRRS